MLNSSDKQSARKTTTQYWGFRELSIEEAACVSGGESIEECMSDGDGETECIPRIEIVGQRPDRVEMGFAPSSFMPVSMSFGGGGGGKPPEPMNPAQKEDFCKKLAAEAVAEVNRAKSDGRISIFALRLVPSDAQIYAAAKQVCLNAR